MARDGAWGAAEGVLVSAARAAGLSSHWVFCPKLASYVSWAPNGRCNHQDQQVKKAPVGASELVIAYIILLHGHFNI